MRKANSASLSLRSTVRSLVSRKFLATCWVIVEAPWRPPGSRMLVTTARASDRINAGVMIEILVFGRQERSLDPVRDRLDRQEQPPLAWRIRPSAGPRTHGRASSPAARSCTRQYRLPRSETARSQSRRNIQSVVSSASYRLLLVLTCPADAEARTQQIICPVSPDNVNKIGRIGIYPILPAAGRVRKPAAPRPKHTLSPSRIRVRKCAVPCRTKTQSCQPRCRQTMAFSLPNGITLCFIGHHCLPAKIISR
jgi:hypothetical protein